MSTIVAVLLTGALFVGPLLWRMRADAQQARADAIAADVRAAISHRFRGETYLTVQVTPRFAGRRGRVRLSAPAGYRWLLEQSWLDVMREMPAGYDLVLEAGDTDARAPTPGPAARDLPRAA